MLITHTCPTPATEPVVPEVVAEVVAAGDGEVVAAVADAVRVFRGVAVRVGDAVEATEQESEASTVKVTRTGLIMGKSIRSRTPAGEEYDGRRLPEG
jgi:hypothetical protein